MCVLRFQISLQTWGFFKFVERSDLSVFMARLQNSASTDLTIMKIKYIDWFHGDQHQDVSSEPLGFPPYS